jgi:hypothetical protein
MNTPNVENVAEYPEFVAFQETHDPVLVALSRKNSSDSLAQRASQISKARSAVTHCRWAVFGKVMAWVGIGMMALLTPAIMATAIFLALPALIFCPVLASVLGTIFIYGPPLLLACLISLGMNMKPSGLGEAKQALKSLEQQSPNPEIEEVQISATHVQPTIPGNWSSDDGEVE